MGRGGGFFFRSQLISDGTLFEPHGLTAFHFDWY